MGRIVRNYERFFGQSPLFKLARVLWRFDHVAISGVNANYGIV